MGYDLSVSRARDPLIVITVFLAIALVMVVLRLRARRLRGSAFGFDDGFMLAAMVKAYFAWLSTYSVLVSGVGRRQAQLHPASQVDQFRLLKVYSHLALVSSAELMDS
ncbi:hypothetical protein LCER1_G005589 [Lachnellula cervina]|uniref:Uncharacterized protein n=1 Tax=Lachnellula cervina TaxID=1316786 RepID=A0A7D8UQQ6_9HELO|nr:hypothetical protein LCER1_G005589 [Lachnellula cervina]